MGQLCGTPLNEVDKELVMMDLKFDSFSSENDKYFINEKGNYLEYMNINEIIFFLYSIKSEETDKSKKSYWDFVAIHKLPILFKNKILRHPVVEYHVEEGSFEFKMFNVFMGKSVSVISKNYKKIHKDVFGEKFKSDKESIPKLSLLPIAFQYCGNTFNRMKLNVMFNLLSENGELNKKSKDLYIFLYFMFVYPANIALLTMNEIGEEDEEIRKLLPEETFLSIYSQYETADAVKAVEKFTLELFGNEESIGYQAFEKTMVDKKLYLIFDKKGVRSYLDKINKEEK